jgi:hypothetical protein
MTARPDLDLDELLGDHAGWYRQFTSGGGSVFYVMAPGPDETAHSYAPDGRSIRRVGWGPETCSSDMRLVPLPEIIWDVNGWYRELQVPYDATRRQLKVAYLRHGGPLSHRKTYVLRQLLQPATRRQYDLCPLGSLFMQDEAVIAMLKRKAAEMASRMTAAGDARTADDVLEEMGFERVPTPDSDEGRARAEQMALEAARSPQEPAEQPWRYAWFRYDADSAEDVMAAWQHQVVHVLAARRMRARIAVGTFAGPDPSTAIWHEGRTIFFLREGDAPTRHAAEMAVRRALDHGLVIVSGSW